MENITDLELAIVHYDANKKEPYTDLVWGALRKQLPISVKRCSHGDYCPLCEWELGIEDMFCAHCGQALKA